MLGQKNDRGWLVNSSVRHAWSEFQLHALWFYVGAGLRAPFARSVRIGGVHKGIGSWGRSELSHPKFDYPNPWVSIPFAGGFGPYALIRLPSEIGQSYRINPFGVTIAYSDVV